MSYVTQKFLRACLWGDSSRHLLKIQRPILDIRELKKKKKKKEKNPQELRFVTIDIIDYTNLVHLLEKDI